MFVEHLKLLYNSLLLQMLDYKIISQKRKMLENYLMKGLSKTTNLQFVLVI